jgi:hypothetical protein
MGYKDINVALMLTYIYLVPDKVTAPYSTQDNATQNEIILYRGS